MTGTQFRAAAVALGWLALLVVPLSVSSPAPAEAVQGARLTSVGSASNSETYKVVYAYCDPGEQVIGGGGRVFNGNGHVMLTMLWPLLAHPDHDADFGGAYVAAAREQAAGYQADWTLRAYAICAPAAAVPGLTAVYKESTTSASQTKTATAWCPGSTRVIGTGGAIHTTWPKSAPATTPQGRVSFQQIRPNSQGRYVLVQGVNDLTNGLSTPDYSAVAVAICADPPTGLQVVSALSLTNPYSKIQVVNCPAGKAAHGAGFTKSDPLGHVYLDAVVPIPDAIFEDAHVVARTRMPPSANLSWNIAAWAVCSN